MIYYSTIIGLSDSVNKPKTALFNSHYHNNHIKSQFIIHFSRYMARNNKMMSKTPVKATKRIINVAIDLYNTYIMALTAKDIYEDSFRRIFCYRLGAESCR